jgi:hypothetical protein
MKTANRARRNAGKNSASAQSGKTTKDTSGKTQSDSVTVSVACSNKELGTFTIPPGSSGKLRVISKHYEGRLQSVIEGAVELLLESFTDEGESKSPGPEVAAPVWGTIAIGPQVATVVEKVAKHFGVDPERFITKAIYDACTSIAKNGSGKVAPLDSNGIFPAMCEPDLEEEACTLDSDGRRALADKLDRWSAQLRLSSDLMDRAGCQLGEPGELVLPDAELAERLRGKSHAHALKLRATFLEWAEQIRVALRLDTNPESHTAKATRELFIWNS